MIDEVEIEVRGGTGGAGAATFRREKFVPKGGPDGGTGGRGGHVLTLANAQLNTLRRYRRTRRLEAADGRRGRSGNRTGRDGEDLILEVPVGTSIIRTGPDSQKDRLADLSEDGMVALLARGGNGGYGNMHFRSATNRAPRVAQRGAPGRSLRLRLELRLIADVGLVGLPNAGKSTLLDRLSNAHPRIGAYPFTTLEPNLGVVRVGWEEFVLADLPGLIEGAADGSGLGHEFLRHTTRTRMLVHIIDGGVEDVLGAFDLINRELAAYSASLAEKPQIVVINKIDQPDVRAREEAVRAAFAARGQQLRWISAAGGEGLEALAKDCLQEVQAAPAGIPKPSPTAPVILRPAPDARRFWVEQEAPQTFRVCGEQTETFVGQMDMENLAAVEEVYRWLQRRGVTSALRRAGMKAGDLVRIGEAEWEWEA